jgi:hypothetical protein
MKMMLGSDRSTLWDAMTAAQQRLIGDVLILLGIFSA